MIQFNRGIKGGWSYLEACNMGAPDYISDTCPICGISKHESPFWSGHHCTPKGIGGSKAFLALRSITGQEYSLRSGIVSLCGSGSSGCHGKCHSPRVYEVQWVFDPDAEALWWDGTLLDSGRIRPNTEDMWEIGHYEVYERHTTPVRKARMSLKVAEIRYGEVVNYY